MNEASRQKKTAEEAVVPEAPDQELSLREIENVTVVFKSYETGLREATILPKVRYQFLARH